MTKPSSGRLSIIPASAIAAQLAGRAEQLCRHLLPEGRRKGCEWRCGSVQGDKGNSLGVHLNGDKAGIWSDFATGDSGDALDLVKAVQGLDTDGAIAWAKNWLGLNSGSRRPPASNSRANGTTPTSSNKAPPDRHPHLGEPTLRHEYTDAEGRLIFYHCRFDLGGGKKTFRPLSRQDGKWAWKDPPGALPLYGLADLAAHAEKPVLLVEGEKTAEVFRELVDDYVNMTWPHGAKAIHKIDWSPLKGRDVTAWPDADGEGHKAMQAAAAKITEAGAGRVAIVALPNGLPDKWDLGDPLPDDWSEDTVRGLIDAAVPVRRVRSGPPDIAGADAARWIGKEPEPLEFVIDGFVPRGMVTAVVADGGAGKSLLTQAMMTCLPSGQPFLGRSVVRGSAAGLFAEDPENVLHHRQRKINSALGVMMEALAGKHFAESSAGFDAVLWRDFKTTKFFSEVEEQLSSIPDLRLVVIDNAALVFAGNENDRVDVTQFIGALTGLAIRLKRRGRLDPAHKQEFRQVGGARRLRIDGMDLGLPIGP